MNHTRLRSGHYSAPGKNGDRPEPGDASVQNTSTGYCKLPNLIIKSLTARMMDSEDIKT